MDSYEIKMWSLAVLFTFVLIGFWVVGVVLWDPYGLLVAQVLSFPVVFLVLPRLLDLVSDDG